MLEDKIGVLVALVNDECRFPIDNPDYEGKIADYLYDICGEAICPINSIPWFMEGSAWCFNGRDEGDIYEAEDEEGNTLFTIEIIEI